ncbi:MAG: serine/threonine protein kinase, partial [uncultured Thermomicrobiales bacterium]
RARREVALKTLRAEYRRDPESRARFRQEARVMAFLSHPNIAKVYDVHEDPEASWVVLEYVPGRSLKQVLAERGALRLGEVADILDQIAGALAHVHAQGLVHLDIKPQNLILEPNGTVKLIDFGLAQPAGRTQESINGTTFGTAAYLAPEQAGGEPVDAATDVYALGCVVYELLTAQPPFPGTGPGTIKNDVIRAHLDTPPPPPSRARPDLDLPRWVDDVVLWALAKQPTNRYRGAASFARVFRAGVNGEGIDSISTTAPMALVDVPLARRAVPTIPAARPVVASAPATAPASQPAASGRIARPAPLAAAYRAGGRAAKRGRRLRRSLWRLTVLFAAANLVLAAILYLSQGADALVGRDPVLQPGARAEVVTDQLNVRLAPDPNSPIQITLERDATVSIGGPSEPGADLVWWPVTVPRGDLTLRGYVWAEGIRAAPDRPAWVDGAMERAGGATEFVRDALRL